MSTQTSSKRKVRRRGRGEGGLYQRASDGLWVGSVTIGYDADGKQRRRTVYGKTKREAQDKLDDLRMKFRLGEPIDVNRITVKEFFLDWIREKKLHTKRGTWSRDESHVNNHIIKFLGHLQLRKVQRRDIVSFYEYLYEEAELAPRTIYDVVTVLRSGFKAAQQQKIISSSPAHEVKKPPKVSPEARFLTPQETLAFRTAAQGHRLEYLFQLMLNTGLRPGEALGLTWDRVDLNQRTITITKALAEVEGELIYGDVKTEASRRTLSLSDEALMALRAQRKLQLEELMAAGPRWNNELNLVFTTITGCPLRRSNVRDRDLGKICARANPPLTSVTLYTFRHTFAAILISQGADPKELQEVLGHEDVTTTYKNYGHLFPGHTKKIAIRMDDFWKSLREDVAH